MEQSNTSSQMLSKGQVNNKFCSGCGKSLMETMRICPSCGGKSFSTSPPINPIPISTLSHSPPGLSVSAPASLAALTQARPWVRYWARTLDICLFSFPIGLFLGIFAPRFTMQIGNDYLFGIVSIFIYVFIEALLLSTFGITPGKWLFRIHLAHASGSQISYSQALARSLKVWWRGLGICFPIVCLVTQIIANERLKRFGITSWDREGGFVLSHEKIGIGRILVAIAIFFIFLLIVAALNPHTTGRVTI